MIPKRYLGDSVYAEIEGGLLKVTTENGDGPTNTIYFEPEVYLALTQFWADAVAAVDAARAAAPEPLVSPRNEWETKS
jgi:hypothetical protein